MLKNITFRDWIIEEFENAALNGRALDIEVHLQSRLNKVHVRVDAVDEDILTGVRLSGFRDDAKRSLMGRIAISVDAIVAVERIDGAFEGYGPQHRVSRTQTPVLPLAHTPASPLRRG